MLATMTLREAGMMIQRILAIIGFETLVFGAVFLAGAIIRARHPRHNRKRL